MRSSTGRQRLSPALDFQKPDQYSHPRPEDLEEQHLHPVRSQDPDGERAPEPPDDIERVRVSLTPDNEPDNQGSGEHMALHIRDASPPAPAVTAATERRPLRAKPVGAARGTRHTPRGAAAAVGRRQRRTRSGLDITADCLR